MSNKYSFPYQKVPSNKILGQEWRKKPLMPITLRHNGITTSYLALVDSGADFNIFHAEIAEVLGIDLSLIKSTVKFGGVKQDKNPCMGYLTSIDLGIGKDFFDNTIVAFSNDISDNGYGIVGQFGFFNYFKVNFDRSKYYFDLTSM